MRAAFSTAPELQPPPAGRLRAYPEIDGVRGILSLIVVAGHVLGIAHWPEVFDDGGSPLYWYWGSMEIFFCISGFLITRNLLRSSLTDRQWVSHYLVKRALRIWPAYYAALVVAALVSLYLPLPPAPQDLVWNLDWAYLLKTLLFLQYTEYYWGGDGAGAIPVFGHSWSVAMEEQFYLAILLLIWLRARTGLFSGKRLLLVVLLLLPFSQVLRALGYSGWTLLGRGEGFLMGIGLAVLEPLLLRAAVTLREHRPWLRQACAYTLCALAPLLLAPYLWAHGYVENLPRLLRIGPANPHFAFSFLGVMLLASIVLAPVTVLHQILRLPFIRYLGEISYSTYLFHIPVLFIVYYALQMLGAHDAMFLLFSPIAVLTVSAMTYRYIELPFLKRKKNYA